MKFLQELLEKHGVSAETVTNILEDKSYEFIPKHRLDQEIDKRKGLETEIANRDKQIKDLSKYAKDNEDLTKKLTDLETTNTEWSTKYDALQLDTAIKLSITDAHNVDTVMKLLPREGLALKEGKVEGLETALQGFKEQHGYLFKEVQQQQQTPGLKGKTPNQGGQQLTTRQQLEQQLQNSKSLVERVALQRQISELE